MKMVADEFSANKSTISSSSSNGLIYMSGRLTGNELAWTVTIMAEQTKKRTPHVEAQTVSTDH